MNLKLGLLKSVIRWTLALSWTTLVIFILLKPGNSSINNKITLEEFLNYFFSLSITRKDIIEAFAHIIMFFILTVLWHKVLIMYRNCANAIIMATGIGLVLAIVTEVGQYFIHRGSLLFDLMANILGIAIAYIYIMCLRKL